MTPSINTRNLRGDIVFAFALALACYLAWIIRSTLVMLYVSALFAVILSPVVRFICQLRMGRWHPSKGLAVLALLLALVSSLTLFASFALPPVVRDLQKFSGEMPTRLPQLLEQARHIPFAQNLNTAGLGAQLQEFASKAVTFLLFSLGNWASRLFDVVMGVILAIYFILEGEHAYRWFLSFFSPKRRERLDKALQRSKIRIDKWLLGQTSLMFILGCCSTIAFLCLHVRYAYALGVLAGLLNIIPVIGAAFTILLALLVAAIDSWESALGVAIFYLVYVQIENSYLIPRIMKNSVDLPGLAILVALLIGSALEGVLGAMVAVPTAVLVAVLLDEYLVHKDVA